MPRFEVRAPLPGFTGSVVGIEFKGGLATVDTGNGAGQAARAYFERAGYRLALLEEDEPEPPADEPFTPGEHRVDDVLAYLETADYDDAVRVLDAEADGQDRVTITGKREAILASKSAPAGDDQKGAGA